VEQAEARHYADGIIAALKPHLRAAAWTWERAGIEAPEPEVLAQWLVDDLAQTAGVAPTAGSGDGIVEALLLGELPQDWTDDTAEPPIAPEKA
jgi:hypothetical protein